MDANQRLATISIDVETDWGGRLKAAPDTVRGVKVGLPQILTILENQEIRSTLFVSGETVPYITEQLQAAVQKGHEIASHGFTHRRLPDLSSTELDQELSQSKAILEAVTGIPVLGFRAPQARKPEDLDQRLATHGYAYDSSVFRGVFPTRFNNLDAPVLPYRQGNIWEIPVSQLPLIPLPMGLLWIDLFSVSVIKLGSRLSGLPPFIHIYMHPFDMIPAYPVEQMPLGAKAWYARKPGAALQTLQRLLTLLKAYGYSFLPAGDVMKAFDTYDAGFPLAQISH